MAAKRLITMRLPPDLVDWADEYARTNGWRQHQADARIRGGAKDGDSGRTGLVQGLLEALREGRLVEAPRAGVNPFPAEERRAGESPDFPALIAFGPEPEVQDGGRYGTDDPEDGDVSYTLFASTPTTEE